MSHWIESHQDQIQSLVENTEWNVSISDSDRGPVILQHPNHNEISIVYPEHMYTDPSQVHYTVQTEYATGDVYTERWSELDHVLQDISRIFEKVSG